MEKGRRDLVLVVLIIFLVFAAVFASEEQHSHLHKDASHFVLVHGACLGAWSWYKLVPLLQSAGHIVTAIDLAASGINLLHANDLQSFSDYSRPLTDFMASVPSHQRVILVGHSFGGAVISQAMEHYPEKVSVGVFLTAAMPGPSFQHSTIAQKMISRVASALDNKLAYDEGPNNPPTSFIFGPKYLSEVVYQYSPAEDAALATMLVRPLQLLPGEELFLSEAKYGSVNRVFLISEDDQVLIEELQKWMIKENPPNRVVTIKGSDHMVMTSQPTQLLAHLLAIAQDYS